MKKWIAAMLALALLCALPFAAQADELPAEAAWPSAETEDATAPDEDATAPDEDATAPDATIPEETPEAAEAVEVADEADAVIAPEAVDAVVEETVEEVDADTASDAADGIAAGEAEAEPAETQAVFEAEAPLIDAEASDIVAEAGGVAINETNFPDPVFRKYVSDKLDKSNPKDNVLDQDEIDAVNGFEVIVVEGMGIKSLKGIEFFPALELLRCSDNELTTLDVSKNTNLITLFCENNKLTSLNVSANPHLDWIHCSGNQLTELDITNCSSYLLKYVDASRFARKDSTVSYTDEHPEDPSQVLVCDASTKIIGGSPVDTWTPPATTTSDPAPAADPAPAPAPVPTVSVTKKSTKATMSVVPGSVIQLDLNGSAGSRFRSSNRKVATVDANGFVTVKKAGKTKITFRTGRKKRAVTLTIKDPTIPTSVTLTAPTTAVKKGDTVALTVTIPEGTTSGFRWKSSNKKVATVNKDGVVTFKRKGKVTITCTAKRGKKKARVRFKVSK